MKYHCKMFCINVQCEISFAILVFKSKNGGEKEVY
jgi:hypothetical protein